MPILYTPEQLQEAQQVFRDEYQRSQLGLTPTEHVEDARAAAHQKTFCRHFGQTAPRAWKALLGLQELATRWSAWRVMYDSHQFPSLDLAAGDRDMARVRVTKIGDRLRSKVEQWAIDHQLNVPWINAAALMTLDAIGCIAFWNLHFGPDDGSEPLPTTLLWADSIVFVVNGESFELGTLTHKFEVFSRIQVQVPAIDFDWDTIHETRTQFRDRVWNTIRASIDLQMDDALQQSGAVAVQADLETHEHHIKWTIQRYAEQRSIKWISEHNDRVRSRAGVRKAIESTRLQLVLEPLPEN